jgi:DNA processing protein
MGLTTLITEDRGFWHPRIARNGAIDTWNEILAGTDSLAARARQIDEVEIEARTDELGLRFITAVDDEWPVALQDLSQVLFCQTIPGGRPIGLWVAGKPLNSSVACNQPGVAFAGMRASSPYGDTVTIQLAEDLARAGYPIVTGGGFGIEIAAVRGAIADGPDSNLTVVLDTGLDQLYPSANAAVLSIVKEKHTLVSEYAPGTTPTRARLLSRGRLVAALASAVVLVEAATRSTALTTLDWAESLQRLVLAVPGPVTSIGSAMPNDCIRTGRARLVASAESIREELRFI